jgi:hypothetical protein
MPDEKNSKLREVAGVWVYDLGYLRFLFSPEKGGQFMGTVKVHNTKEELYHMDRFNLVVSQNRAKFIKVASEKVRISALEMESHLDQFALALSEEIGNQKEEIKKIELSEKDKKWGETFLKNPNMFGELAEDFKTLGCVGEESNLLICYLIANSRLLVGTLAGVVTSQSGAGKSVIFNTALKLIPPEEKMLLTRMTPTAFYYQPEGRLKHKVIGLGEEVGAKEADLALRCLLSDGFLTNLVTSRDPRTGQLSSQETKTEGPSSFLTTTTVDRLDTETLSRFLRLSANETPEQTREILRLQRESRSLEGLETRYLGSHVIKKHHAAQRMLKKIEVVNPYYKELSFREDLFRLRREQEKYLRLIDTIALLRQHQKEKKQHLIARIESHIAYIEVSLEDIELANKLARQVLTITLDELRPQSRNLLEIIYKNVCREIKLKGIKFQDYRFTRRDIRSWSQFPDTHVRRYLEDLQHYEYIKAHRGTQGSLYEYELLFYDNPQKENEFDLGLLDVEKLREARRPVSIGFMEKFSKLVGV